MRKASHPAHVILRAGDEGKSNEKTKLEVPPQQKQCLDQPDAEHPSFVKLKKSKVRRETHPGTTQTYDWKQATDRHTSSHHERNENNDWISHSCGKPSSV
jgi:hypothetical protein